MLARAWEQDYDDNDKDDEDDEDDDDDDDDDDDSDEDDDDRPLPPLLLHLGSTDSPAGSPYLASNRPWVTIWMKTCKIAFLQ